MDYPEDTEYFEQSNDLDSSTAEENNLIETENMEDPSEQYV